MQARTRGAPPRTAQQWQRPRRSQLTCLNASKNRMQGSSGRETQFAAPAELHVVFNDQCTNEHEWQILDALTSCTCPSRMQRPTWPNAEAKGSIRCKRTWPLSLARPPLIDPLAKCATTLSPLQLLHSRSDKETRSGPPAPHAKKSADSCKGLSPSAASRRVAWRGGGQRPPGVGARGPRRASRPPLGGGECTSVPHHGKGRAI